MTSIGTLFTQFTSWMTSIVTTMTAEGNEIMLIPVGIMVVGAVIGLASRLIGRQSKGGFKMGEGAHTALTSLQTLFTSLTGWMSNIVSTVTKSGNEIMLIPIGIFVVGAVIGLASRLIGRQFILG